MDEQVKVGSHTNQSEPWILMFASVTGVTSVALWLCLNRVNWVSTFKFTKNCGCCGGNEVFVPVFFRVRIDLSPFCAHLPLLEGLSSHVAPAGRLEHGQVLPGLLIPLLLQLSQGAGPEEQLQFNINIDYHQTKCLILMKDTNAKNIVFYNYKAYFRLTAPELVLLARHDSSAIISLLFFCTINYRHHRPLIDNYI